MSPRTARPPGIAPLDPSAWTVTHGDFAAQMRYRTELIATRPAEVIDCLAEGEDAAEELRDCLLAHLVEKQGYAVADGRAHRADGCGVPLDLPALSAIGQMVAEDFCLLRPDPLAGEYRLVAAVLCFPSRWRLAEKMGRPLTRIHDPVADYDDELARRVNRMFEALAVGRPLVRANWTVHTDPELFQPDSVAAKRQPVPEGPLYLRTERQTLVRLPRTGAVAFGIKTSVTPASDLPPEILRGLGRAYADRVAEARATFGVSEQAETICDRLDALAART